VGKRSDGAFKRRKNDAYNTPPSPVLALLPHLKKGTRFIEPCAGRGHLISHLADHGHECVYASDIAADNSPPRRGEPRTATKYTYRKDALTLTRENVERYCREEPDAVITNPPWTRELLHPMILNLRTIRPTWLLFDADWMHTIQAAPLLDMCSKVVSVGRVKWIPKSKHVGMDNAAWYLFPMRHSGGPKFIPRRGGNHADAASH
jgi:hypothetical protein